VTCKGCLGTLVALGLGGLLVIMGVAYLSDRDVGERNLSPQPSSPTMISRGAYLAKLGDCAACHSIPGKPAFSGGLKMQIPFGAIYTTNITPDPLYGIGRFSLTDFDRALRFGIADGHSLYPAMPFASYANTRPEDVAALYAYFKYGVSAATAPNRRNAIVFPLSMRWPLTYWRLLFAPRPKPFQRTPGEDPEMARGAYFVEGLGHCGECHTPRTVAMRVKAQTPADGDAFLSGAVVENYFAPSLRNGGPGTLGNWSEAQLVEFLQNGANSNGIAFGSMADVIAHSTQYLLPEDAIATAKYLKSLHDAHDGVSTPFVYDEVVHRALKSGDAGKLGAMTYLDNCAACHRTDGLGSQRVFPRLAGNPVVQAANPLSLISVILQGSTTPRTRAAPAQFAMPSFASRLSDQDIADLVNFIRTSWGNNASSVAAEDIAKIRRIGTRKSGAGNVQTLDLISIAEVKHVFN
jgi:mono/diheme cytochrome c family protein